MTQNKRIGWVAITANQYREVYQPMFTTDPKRAKRWREMIEDGIIEEVFPVARLEEER
jgi:hypothetical protein